MRARCVGMVPWGGLQDLSSGSAGAMRMVGACASAAVIKQICCMRLAAHSLVSAKAFTKRFDSRRLYADHEVIHDSEAI